METKSFVFFFLTAGIEKGKKIERGRRADTLGIAESSFTLRVLLKQLVLGEEVNFQHVLVVISKVF